MTVNELEKGEFHYTLLKPVIGVGDLLSYQPDATGEMAHTYPLAAWMAGLCALRGKGALANGAAAEMSCVPRCVQEPGADGLESPSMSCTPGRRPAYVPPHP